MKQRHLRILALLIVTACERGPIVVGRIPVTGGRIHLPHYATIQFPAQSFRSTARVTIRAAAEADIRELYEKSPFHWTRALHEIRIETGLDFPIEDLEVTLVLPPHFLDEHHEAALLTRIIRPGDRARLLPLVTLHNPKSGVVRARLPRDAFSRRGAHDPYEAIVLLNAVPES